MIWLNLKESSELVGKSQSTIKRHLVEHGISYDQPNSDLTGKLIYRKEQASRGFNWYIDKESLIAFYQSPINQSKSDSQPFDQSRLINEIEFLKDQIKEKDITISKLLERIRELNILIKQSQEIKLIENKQGRISSFLSKFGL